MGSGSDEATTRGSWPSPEQALKTRRKQIDPEFGCWELRCRFRCMQPWGRRKAWGETGPVRQQHCCPASAAMHTPTTMCLSPAVGENRLKRSSRGFPSQATQQPNNPATQQPSKEPHQGHLTTLGLLLAVTWSLPFRPVFALSISIMIIPSPMPIAGMAARASPLARHAPAVSQC